LLEVALDKQCDAVIFVDASREVRLKRLIAGRGWAEQDLARREKNQLLLDTKARRADYVVVNDADEAETRSQVSGVFSQIMTQHEQRSGGSSTR
jgi:dephospho-CoA kinase